VLFTVNSTVCKRWAQPNSACDKTNGKPLSKRRQRHTRQHCCDRLRTTAVTQMLHKLLHNSYQTGYKDGYICQNVYKHSHKKALPALAVSSRPYSMCSRAVWYPSSSCTAARPAASSNGLSSVPKEGDCSAERSVERSAGRFSTSCLFVAPLDLLLNAVVLSAVLLAVVLLMLLLPVKEGGAPTSAVSDK
jgi:hypothetical protein